MRIINNFGEAASNYNNAAKLQKKFAWELAKHCAKQEIPEGIWVDLGTGTGLLADALEKLHPNQSILRVDGSEEMLLEHNPNKIVQLYDLNSGLPKWSKQPTLIASSFALHWLCNPQEKITSWFSALAPKGLLAIALPVDKSFPEWHEAAIKAGVECSAMDFPSQNSLLNAFDIEQIKYQKLYRYSQVAQNMSELFKPIIKVGAHASKTKSLKIGEWRRLQKNWAKENKEELFKLTWLVQILLVQK